jgi:Endonuclease/Exonuclease/phosphatase family
MKPSLVVGIWNVQWKTVASLQGRNMSEILNSQAPDIVCVTEGYVDQMLGDWYACPSEADHGYRPLIEGRRKVVLFSRKPWTDIDAIGNSKLPPGRFVSAITETPLGPLRCAGVCIPWKDAHVRSGTKDKIRWEDHKSYLRALRPVIENLPENAIIVGDFNQRIPRGGNPQDTAELLMSSLGEQLSIVTSGQIPDVAEQSIDHLACRSYLEVKRIRGLPKIQDNVNLSDHFGLIVELERSQSSSPTTKIQK